MTITTRLYTALFGEFVGKDNFGNRYYQRKGRAGGEFDTRHDRKRWVIYNGLAEPSKVPPEWHGWLHYTLDIPPSEQPVAHHSWEKPPIPNLTGTINAYTQPGHLNRGAQRSSSTSDYQPWEP